MTTTTDNWQEFMSAVNGEQLRADLTESIMTVLRDHYTVDVDEEPSDIDEDTSEREI